MFPVDDLLLAVNMAVRRIFTDDVFPSGTITVAFDPDSRSVTVTYQTRTAVVELGT